MSDYMDVLELYERFTLSGTPYIVAKAGFMFQAVIMPYDAINTQFVKRLQELAEQCAVSLDLREREAADDLAQFRVDPSTGEVVAPEREGEE